MFDTVNPLEPPKFAPPRAMQWSFFDGNKWIDYDTKDNDALESCASHYEQQSAGVNGSVHVSDFEVVEVNSMQQLTRDGSVPPVPVRRVCIATGNVVNDPERPIVCVSDAAVLRNLSAMGP